MKIRDNTTVMGSPPSDANPAESAATSRISNSAASINQPASLTHGPRRRALTLSEVLVVLIIACVVIGMSIPAMQNMREMARRSNCQQNLSQLSLAISNYASTFDHYPIGTINDRGPIHSEPVGYHHNWISGLLPMLEYTQADDSIDRTVGVYAPANELVRVMSLPKLLCPTSGRLRNNTTCYAGISGSEETPIDVTNDGVFLLNRIITDGDIADGLGYTTFLGEKRSHPDDDLGWISGTRSSLRVGAHPINSVGDHLEVSDASSDPLYVGGLSSDHFGGAYVLMGSGENEFRSSTMDPELLRKLSSRSDQTD